MVFVLSTDVNNLTLSSFAEYHLAENRDFSKVVVEEALFDEGRLHRKTAFI